MKNDLPELCYSVLETSREVVIIRRGESGYTSISFPWETMNIRELKDYAGRQNDMRGILPKERMAMEVGSMFGWDLPGTDPQIYLDQAEMISKKQTKAHIKDSILSIFYPVGGDLYEYHLLGEKRRH